MRLLLPASRLHCLHAGEEGVRGGMERRERPTREGPTRETREKDGLERGTDEGELFPLHCTCGEPRVATSPAFRIVDVE